MPGEMVPSIRWEESSVKGRVSCDLTSLGAYQHCRPLDVDNIDALMLLTSWDETF